LLVFALLNVISCLLLVLLLWLLLWNLFCCLLFLHAQLQSLWQAHLQDIWQLVPSGTWRIFSAVRHETRVCQSAVLGAVRKIIDPVERHRWPKDRRQLDAMMAHVGGFNGRITRTVTIDMSDFGAGQISWKFVDPVYAWAATAGHLSQKHVRLWFGYFPRYNPSRQRLYGTSVNCGEVMRKACERVYARCVSATNLINKH
jgi:hypothetical protein